MKSEEEQTNTVRNMILDLNQTWAQGNPLDMQNYFHEKIMIVAPNLTILGTGREECIQSYVDFLARSVIKEFEDDVTQVFIFGQTAVVFYKCHVTWITDEKEYRESGQELYVLNYENDQWLIVLRKIIAQDQ